jgi:hypothetical protein
VISFVIKCVAPGFRVDTIGFLVHDIVILLDPSEIADRHRHRGVTVHPAQGVMTLTVVFWPRSKQH